MKIFKNPIQHLLYKSELVIGPNYIRVIKEPIFQKYVANLGDIEKEKIKELETIYTPSSETLLHRREIRFVIQNELFWSDFAQTFSQVLGFHGFIFKMGNEENQEPTFSAYLKNGLYAFSHFLFLLKFQKKWWVFIRVKMDWRNLMLT